MNRENNYGRSPAAAIPESTLEKWRRLCQSWASTLEHAQNSGDSIEAARAELTLAMCERERSRVEQLFSRPHP